MSQDIAELQALWLENNAYIVSDCDAGTLADDQKLWTKERVYWVVSRGMDTHGDDYTYVHRVWPRLIYEKNPGSSYVDYWV